MYVVQVTEVSPPPGGETIDWTLLTNEPVQSFQDAWRVTGWYERRWTVEEYHWHHILAERRGQTA